MCVCEKKGATFNGRYKSPVWRYPTVRPKRHPTEKNLAMFKDIVEISSNSGDIVFDPFIGSGTTAEAAIQTGRRYFGADLDPEFVKVAASRAANAAASLKNE